MTVSSDINKSGPYNGNGVTDVFDYDFRIVSDSHLEVILTSAAGVETVLTKDQDYAVSGVGDDNGGSVTLVTPPASGELLTIIRNVPFVQDTDLENQGPYYAETVEDALDLAVMRDQQLQEQVDRSVKIPASADESDLDGFLNAVYNLSGRLLSPSPTDPLTRDDGRPLQVGDIYYNTVAKEARVWSGDTWSTFGAPSSNMISEQFTGDGSTLDFDLSLAPGSGQNVLVWLDGVRQVPGEDYNVSGKTLSFVTAPVDGAQVDVLILSVLSGSFIPPNNSVGGDAIIDGSVSSPKTDGSISAYQLQDRALDLGVNDTLLSGGFSGVRSPVEERDDNFAKPALFPQAATDLGTCLLLPPSEESTNFVAPTVPWLTHRGNNFRCIPLDIRTVLHNTPIGIPLFEPVRTNASGFLVWRYIGNDPLHVMIEGGFDVYVRNSGNLANEDAWSRLILGLRAWDYPLLDDSQGGGTRYLATSHGVLETPQFFRDTRIFNDPCSPITQSVINNAATWPELYAGSQNGFFNPGDTDENLRDADAEGGIGPEVRTTNWIDLEDYPPNIRCFLFNFDGKSTRGRMQCKTDGGSIFTYGAMTRDISGRRIYRVPSDVRYVRIYYSGRGDTAENESFRPLGASFGADRDPVKGYWSVRNFNVRRDVVFWPGASYALYFATNIYDGASAVDWGFRFQGGGLSFNFDAGPMRKTLSSKLFKG